MRHLHSMEHLLQSCQNEYIKPIVNERKLERPHQTYLFATLCFFADTVLSDYFNYKSKNSCLHSSLSFQALKGADYIDCLRVFEPNKCAKSASFVSK